MGKRLEQELGVEFRIVRHHRGGVSVDDFARRVDRNTRLIFVPWVSNISAFRIDISGLAELAHAHGAQLFVDAIQLVGTEPIDVKRENLDYMCSGTYKWLMSGWGVAPMYVRRDLLDTMRPTHSGWQTALWNPSTDYHYTERTSAAKLEYASPSFDQFYTLSAALEYLDGLGLQAIRDYSRTQVKYLRNRLENMGFSMFTPAGNVAPTLTFWVGAGEKWVESECRRAGIRIGFASGSRMAETYGDNPDVSRVRVSPAHYNVQSDLDAFLEVASALPRCDPPRD